MIRVLHVITKLELGGAQLNTIYTVEHLDPRRFEAHLFSGPGGMLHDEVEASLGERFQTVPNLRRGISPIDEIRAYNQLRRMIRKLKPEIVQTHSSKAGILGRLAAHEEKVPVIIHTVHGFGITAVKGGAMQTVLKSAERFAARRTTHFFPVSQENFDTGKSLGLFDETNASCLVEGVNLKVFRQADYRPEKLAEFGLSSGTPIIGCISCFKPQKNLSALVDVAAMVVEQFPEAHFMVLGDGEEKPMVEEKITKLGLAENFTLAGWRRDVPELVKLWNVSVLTSRWEGLPRAISESLSAKIPVVVTRAGGSAEAVRQGETGWVVEQGEWRKMADHILDLLNNPEKARQMGERGPDSVLPWDIINMVRAQEAKYEELLAEITP